MKLQYNPLYSAYTYRKMVKAGAVKVWDEALEKAVLIHDLYPHNVFLQMQMFHANGTPKVGEVIFEIIFHAGTMTVDEIIKKTPSTLPFFAGLPGFCAKQFMVNEVAGTFSGRYEWETASHVKAYLGSFAVAAMIKQSKPYPIRYRILDKTTGAVLEEESI